MTSFGPDKVAQSFLKQYYNLLSTNPDDLHRFYNEQSSFAHSYGQHVEPSARGQAEIREKVAALNLAGARVDLSDGTVDAQLSVDNAVFVTVTGTFTSSDQIARPFVQSFFLATQPGAQNSRSYFVMNSVFRQLSIEAPTAHGHVAEKTVQHQQVEADKGAGSVPQVVEKAPVHEPVAEEPVAAVVHPEHPAHEEVEVTTEAVPEEVQPAVVVEEQVSTSAREAPKSFLDAVKKSLPANGAAPAPAATVTARAPRPPRTAAQPREEKAEAKKEEAATTFALWISNLAPETTTDELRGMFAKFGNVQNVEIPQDRGFAFVEYDAADAVQAVLNSGEQFTLHDKQLRVEAKTSAKAGRKGGASKPRGASPKNGERREKGKEGPRRDAKRPPQREGARQQDGGAARKK